MSLIYYLGEFYGSHLYILIYSTKFYGSTEPQKMQNL